MKNHGNSTVQNLFWLTCCSSCKFYWSCIYAHTIHMSLKTLKCDDFFPKTKLIPLLKQNCFCLLIKFDSVLQASWSCPTPTAPEDELFTGSFLPPTLRKPSVKHMSSRFSRRSRCDASDQRRRRTAGWRDLRHWADWRRRAAFEGRMLVSGPVNLLLPSFCFLLHVTCERFLLAVHLWSSAVTVWFFDSAPSFECERVAKRSGLQQWNLLKPVQFQVAVRWK